MVVLVRVLKGTASVVLANWLVVVSESQSHGYENLKSGLAPGPGPVHALKLP